MMTPTADKVSPLSLPDPERIRAAISEADERAKLLRRLLRLALRLQLHLVTADKLPTPAAPPAKGVGRG